MAQNFDINTVSVQMTVTPTTVTTVLDPESYDKGYEVGKSDGMEEGYNSGRADGYTEGKTEGYSQGYGQGYREGEMIGLAQGEEAGKKAESNTFWNGFLLNGERKNFNNAFAYGGSVSTTPWTNQNFKPNHPMTPTYANNMFTKFGYVGDLTEAVELSFAVCSEMDGAFVNCPYITRLGVIDFRSLTSCSGFVVNNMPALETIDKLIFGHNANNSLRKNGLTFPKCGALVNIIVEGMIDFSINFSSSPLNLKSAVSVIEALKSLNEDSFRLTVTFSEMTKGLLAEAGAIFPQGCTWEDYLTHLGWNY